MKKGKLYLLFIIPLLFTGCFFSSSDSEEVKPNICTLISDQSANGYVITTKYAIYSTDGIVDKVEQLEVVSSKDDKLLNYFKDQNSSQYKSINEQYGGYSYFIVKRDNEVISALTIDYSEFDMKKFANDNKGMESYINSDNKITFDGITKMYKNIGATCK